MQTTSNKDYSKLRERLEELIFTFDLSYFPSRDEIQKLTQSTALDNAIQRSGGYKYWASQLGLPNKSQVNRQSKWAEEKVIQELNNVITTLNLTRFPSLPEIDTVCGNSGLSGHITKVGGVRYWANLLNLPLKESVSKTGWYGEDILEKKIKEIGYEIEKQTTICPYDFLIDSNVRVDSKYSRIYHGINGNFYSFNLGNKSHECDIFICICDDENGNLKFLVIPYPVLTNHSQISVGIHNSKWNKYLNRFDVIDKYIGFYKDIKKG